MAMYTNDYVLSVSPRILDFLSVLSDLTAIC